MSVSSSFDGAWPSEAEEPATAAEVADPEASRLSTQALLLPGGRPGGWLLVVAAAWIVVFVYEVAARVG